MNKIAIISLFLLSVLVTTIFISILYVLTETSVGHWIENLVIHPKLTYGNLLFILGLILSLALRLLFIRGYAAHIITKTGINK
jgi:hypothetical protein